MRSIYKSTSIVVLWFYGEKMASLVFDEGDRLTDLAGIAKTLGQLGVVLAHWPVDAGPILEKLQLSDEERAWLLGLYGQRFNQIKEDITYKNYDLVVLNYETPKLDQLMGQFERCHVHDDDEVRYILSGEGVFGFVLPGGHQVELTVGAGDLALIPANTEHWFRLSQKRSIKAIRYFSTNEKWEARYTGTPIHAFPK